MATANQRRYLRVLAVKAGIEPPEVVSFEEAEEAIDRLKERLRQPHLEGL
jgi:hypothetical protein